MNSATSSIHYKAAHQAHMSFKSAVIVCASVIAGAVVMITFVR